MKEIIYPTLWDFLIITEDKNALIDIIKNDDKFKNADFIYKNTSKNGKFESYNLTMRVENQLMRDNIFNILKNINGVKIVI